MEIVKGCRVGFMSPSPPVYFHRYRFGATADGSMAFATEIEVLNVSLCLLEFANAKDTTRSQEGRRGKVTHSSAFHVKLHAWDLMEDINILSFLHTIKLQFLVECLLKALAILQFHFVKGKKQVALWNCSKGGQALFSEDDLEIF
ncbi:hypothetical protein M9H77_20074 [Catharanthus roseus]|uniref:Uncharacterized protein n=1 Tax=Catharanthus roseus TaxID=4058 RepID=A0ACC0AMM8_CATRO|nr:hypothetical protein M9H77_20074 [Catharanthus roseus]